MLDCECASGRKAFPSYAEAMRTVKFIRRNGKDKNQGTPRRPYKCKTGCGFWHLTSWTSRGNWWD